MSNTASALARIEALVQQGLILQAEASCHELLKSSPREDKAWAWLGVLALNSGRPADAEIAFRHATAIDRYNASYWTNLGNAVTSLGHFADAEGHLRRALSLDQSVSAYWNNLAG